MITFQPSVPAIFSVATGVTWANTARAKSLVGGRLRTSDGKLIPATPSSCALTFR